MTKPHPNRVRRLTGNNPSDTSDQTPPKSEEPPKSQEPGNWCSIRRAWSYVYLSHVSDEPLIVAVSTKTGSSQSVGVTGFEPATLCSQSRCATKLRHTPALPTHGNSDDHTRQFVLIVPCLLVEAEPWRISRATNMVFLFESQGSEPDFRSAAYALARVKYCRNRGRYRKLRPALSCCHRQRSMLLVERPSAPHSWHIGSTKEAPSFGC